MMSWTGEELRGIIHNTPTYLVRFEPGSSKHHQHHQKFLLFLFFSFALIHLFPFIIHKMATEKGQLKLGIEKLNGANYQSWKRDMQMVLIKKGVWDNLGEVPQLGEERSWRRAQQLGLAEIHLACEPEQKQLISEAVDMTEAWDILTRRYEAPSVANIMRLEQEFATLRMMLTESVDKFITRVKAKAQELRAVGVEIPSARISNTILGGLPKDYLSVVTAMTTRPGNFRVEDVTEAVLNHEATLKRFEPTNSASVPQLHHSPAVTAMSHLPVHMPHTVQHAVAVDLPNNCPPCPVQNCTCQQNVHPVGPIRSTQLSPYVHRPQYGGVPIFWN